MNKNTIGILLMGLILFWMMSNSAQEQKIAEKEQSDKAEQTKDSSNESMVALGTVNEVADSYRAPVFRVDSADTSKVDTLSAPAIINKSISVETNKFRVILSNQGAMIRSAVLKSLEGEKGGFPELIQDNAKGLLGLEIDEKDFSQVLFETTAKDSVYLVSGHQDIEFTWKDSQGRLIRRTYSFDATSDKFDHAIQFENFKPTDLRYHWKGGMSETEDVSKIGSFGSNYYFSEIIYYDGESVYRETTDEVDKFNEEKAGLNWLGLRRRYAAVFFEFPEPVFSNVIATPIEQAEDNPAPITYSVSWSADLNNMKDQFEVHLQPLLHSDLEAMGKHQEEILFSGWSIVGADVWFVWICGLILSFLNLLFAWIGNYGLAIIVLTILVKLATMPLTLNQIRSMRAMAEHKPALDKLRKKHSSDPQKYQSEMLKYYKNAGINPLAPVMGCLPMFLQMPIFIGLFVVLGRAVELRGQPFVGWINDLSQPDIIFDGISLPLIMPHGLSLLPPIMAITMYLQMKQSMTSADPIAKNMVFIMPVMMFLFSAMMPSGLVVYWIVSNLFTIFQYKFVGSSSPSAGNIKEAEIVSSKKKK